MKRTLIAFLLVPLLLFSGCGLLSGGEDEAPVTIAPAPSADEMQAVLQPLVERNFVLYAQVFVADTLQYDENRPVDGVVDAYAVNSNLFSSYAQLDAYVRSTYEALSADELLLNVMDGQQYPLYFEQDGQLCINTAAAFSPVQLQYNTTVFSIRVQTTTTLSCAFTVTVQALADGREMKIPMTAINTDGVWLLEGMFYEAEEHQVTQ